MSAVLRNPCGPRSAADRLVRSVANAKGGFVRLYCASLTPKLARHLRSEPGCLRPVANVTTPELPTAVFRLSRRAGKQARATLRWLNIAAGDIDHPSQQVREAAKGIGKLNLNWGQLEDALRRYRSIRLQANRAAASHQPVTDRQAHQFPTGEAITPVRTPSELQALGHTMRNCLAGRAFRTARRNMRMGTCEYYVLTDRAGDPVGLMGVSDDDEGFRTVDEIKGPGNAAVEGWATRLSEYLRIAGIGCGDHCGDLIAMGVTDQYCTTEGAPRALFDDIIDGLRCIVEMPAVSGSQHYVDLRITYGRTCGMIRYSKGQVVPLITYGGGGLKFEQVIYLLLKSRLELDSVGVEICMPDRGDPVAPRVTMRGLGVGLFGDEAEE